MTNYVTLLALTSDERSLDLKTSYFATAKLNTSKGELQKHAAKVLVSMSGAGDCKAGEYRKYAMKITGADIREEMQDVYGLIAVFSAVIAGEIEISEEEFDSMESSKLALLSPFLSKEELMPFLDEAVAAAKTGTAKDIRDLKPKKDKADKDEPAEKPAGTKVEFGFIATDIGASDPLIRSTQALNRLKADFTAAADDTSDAGTTLLNEMMWVFGSMLASTAAALETDAAEFVAEIVANMAKAAAGSDATVAPPAALAIAV